jgi:hypothetical protein
MDNSAGSPAEAEADLEIPRTLSIRMELPKSTATAKMLVSWLSPDFLFAKRISSGCPVVHNACEALPETRWNAEALSDWVFLPIP